MAHTRSQAAELVAAVESALEDVERLADPAARDVALDAVQALLELYGEGFGRLLALTGGAEPGPLTEDELVAHLLLVHGLHPVPVEQRVAQGLDDVRPYLASHGGGVELVGIEDGIALLSLEGTCDGCPSSALTLEAAVEEAVRKAAPEIVEVRAQGARPAPALPGPVTLPMVHAGGNGNGSGNGRAVDEPRVDGRHPSGGEGPAQAPAPAADPIAGGHFWGVLHGLDVADGALVLDDVNGRPVLFANLAGTLYAYRPGCPACGGSLAGGRLAGFELSCGCGARYDVKRAGRRLDGDSRRLGGDCRGLDPLPLLATEPGTVKVALARVGA